jgi:hypothetical protein
VTAYRVYRANLTDGRFNAGEIFNCIHTGSTRAGSAEIRPTRPWGTCSPTSWSP